MKTPYALIIMDGYGLNPQTDGNAISMDGSKNVNELRKNYPSATLGASGLSVGLPDGQMGNSEVGHLNMGAGRIVYQDLTKITKAIDDGDFFENGALLKAMENAKQNGKKLHLWGLLSDGGVHSHITHLYALLQMAKSYGVPQTYVHCFMDGRDVSPTSGVEFVKELQTKINELGYGKIASLSGRYYAMDRDNNWDRVEKAYDMLTVGSGVKCECPVKALEESMNLFCRRASWKTASPSRWWNRATASSSLTSAPTERARSRGHSRSGNSPFQKARRLNAKRDI